MSMVRRTMPVARIAKSCQWIAAGIMLAAGVARGAEPTDGRPGKLLFHDSFEEGDRGPDGWQEGRAVPGVEYVWDRREASDGMRSLGLAKRAQRYFPIAQWTRSVPCEHSGSTLLVAVDVKAEQMTKAVVDALFLDDRGRPISHEWAAYIGAKDAGDPPADHDWKEYSGSVEIPEGTERLVVGLQVYGPGSVRFDELEVRIVESEDQPSRARASGEPVARDSRDRPNGDASAAEAIEIQVNDNAAGRYLLAGPDEEQRPPRGGYGLLVVLPGGAGTADFHPFVRRIREHALDDSLLAAQPLAVKWTERQEVVWPTKHNRVARMGYSTEELVAGVIDHVSEEHGVDRERVYLLAWSSGGPAAYATLLQDDSPARGGLIAMSVFKPSQLPPLESARGRSFYLLHSPEDRVCPFRMALVADKLLESAGANVELVEYAGGHGWRGDVFGNIRRGVEWLEAQSDRAAR